MSRSDGVKGAMQILAQATKRGLGSLAGDTPPAGPRVSHSQANVRPCICTGVSSDITPAPREQFNFYIFLFFSFIKGKKSLP